MGEKYKLLFETGERCQQRLRHLSGATELPMAELLRRMVDHCWSDPDGVLPAFSGRIDTGEARCD